MFSAGGETDTRRRNQIAPHLMEQLQMLKFMLKKDRLDFTPEWYVTEKDTEVENEWQDCAKLVGANGDKDNVFLSFLDLLEETDVSPVTQPAEISSVPQVQSREQLDCSDTEEVSDFDDDEMYFSGE